MRLNWVPVATALLPAVGAHVSYLISASHGHVPWCLIYIDGCTSISATGRNMPERAVFLGTILPGALLMMLYWRLCAGWLGRLRGAAAPVDRVLSALGLLVGLALIVYLATLGQPGDTTKLVRRVAVAVFFVTLYLCQVLLTWQLVRLGRGGAWLWTLVGLAAIVAAGALLSLVLLALRDDFRDMEDAFEWSLTVLIFAHILVTGTGWRRSGFAAAT